MFISFGKLVTKVYNEQDRRLPPGITALLKLEGRNFLLLERRCVNNNQRLLIVNVYAPCDLAGKRVLWDELRQSRASNPNGLWCFLGDFNSIWSPEERISLTQRSVDSYDILTFNQWISDMELQEIKCVCSSFTWIRPNGCVKSRLDRFLVSEQWLSLWSDRWRDINRDDYFRSI